MDCINVMAMEAKEDANTDECHADFDIHEIEEAQTLVSTLAYIESVELS